ncbi:hypothetical protein [Bradyrhizobium sp. URHD0069]|uniref:DUF7940 domain-containing protein n=1 Tax=Bradyrhizobium sp. URHD0069 TaxID=1380355 RepID=UPI000495E7DE|nr:hypothetical protein [Bradyrhizobium sp. URHD0069]
MRLIDNASREVHRLWTVRIALFAGVLNGVAFGLAAFVDVFNPWLFMGLNVLVYGLIAVARLIKQAPPADEAGAA